MNRFPGWINRSTFACLLLVLHATATAHEFWIEPSRFQPNPGERIGLTLRVGQELAGETIPYLPERIEKFVYRGPDGLRAIASMLGDDPAGHFVPATSGRYSVAVITHPFEVTFDTGEEFEQYLVKEGLERHLETHRARHRPGRKILETYFRCAKTLVRAGADAADAPEPALGLPLELVAEQLPKPAAPTVQLRLLYQGLPLEGALVLFMNKLSPKNKITVRTDREGRVRVPLGQKGFWLANSVHMLKAPFYAKEDWNSMWASLTFEVR